MCYKSAVSQQLEESSIDGLGGVFRVPGESVGILAECVHVLAVAYQLFDFALWQRLDHANKGVPQLIHTDILSMPFALQ